MRWTRLFVIGAVVGAGLSVAEQARANINTYTNQATWEAAVAATITLEDLNDEAPGEFSTRDLGDFTATLTNAYSTRRPGIFAGSASGNVNGTNFLRLQTRQYYSNTDLNFDFPIFALGFDWRNTDTSGDDMELLIAEDGFQYTFGRDRRSGFFGVIRTDGTFSTASLSDTSGDGGVLGYGAIDNIRYAQPGSDDGVIPEPSTMIVWSLLTALGIGFGLRRRRKAA